MTTAVPATVNMEEPVSPRVVRAPCYPPPKRWLRKGTLVYLSGCGLIVGIRVGLVFAFGIVIAAIVLACVVAYTLKRDYDLWCKGFAHRHDRSDALSPSHNLKPPLRGAGEHTSKILEEASNARRISIMEAAKQAKEREPTKIELASSAEMRQRASPFHIPSSKASPLGKCPFKHDPATSADTPAETPANDAEVIVEEGEDTVGPMRIGPKPLAKALSDSEHEVLKKRRPSSLATQGIRSRANSAFMQDGERLDMDHVKVTFGQYLYGVYGLQLNLYACTVSGLANYAYHKYMQKFYRKFLGRNFYNLPTEDAYRRSVADLILETTLAIHFLCFRDDPHTTDKIGVFAYADVPLPENNGKRRVYKLLTFTLNLTKRMMVKGMLDDVELSPRDALCIMGFYGAIGHHVKVHSYANWGCNTEVTAKIDPYIRNMSVLSVMYNFFGKNGFDEFLSMLASWGVLDCPVDASKCIDFGISQGVHSHGDVKSLVPYSDFVNFIYKLRPTFLAEFAQRKEEFPDIDGEALYIATSMHSLDHTQYSRYIGEPQYLEPENSDFKLLALVAAVSRSGFTDDLPCLLVPARFYQSPHPFYQSIYKKALKIDVWFANQMDAAMIK